MSPVGAEWWKVGETWVGWEWGGVVVAIPAATVLVGEVTPSPVGEGAVRGDPEGVERVDASGIDGAEVGPVVTEIEDVEELLAAGEAAEFDSAVVEGGRAVFPVDVGGGEAGSVGQGEFVEVGSVPAGEGVVDGVRQLREGMAPCCRGWTNPIPRRAEACAWLSAAC